MTLVTKQFKRGIAGINCYKERKNQQPSWAGPYQFYMAMGKIRFHSYNTLIHV